MENKYDENVRKALELKGLSLHHQETATTTENWHRKIEDLSYIAIQLKRVFGKTVYFKPYKLNIYQKGGFFKPQCGYSS